jgi:hypothetical protein
VAIATLSRSIAALAESDRVRMQKDDAMGLDGALDAISLFASMLTAHPNAANDHVMLPQAALTRAARLLTSAANLTCERSLSSVVEADVAEASLAAAFERDDLRLRDLVSSYGSSPEAGPGS